ncbi:MAG: N-acetyl-gamma-glutamyl-phosphate reductase [Myxococcota bacterium]
MEITMADKTIRTAVVGGTGYTGAELVRLVLGHPSLELVSVVGNATAGQSIASVLPSLRGIVDGDVEVFDPAALAKRVDVAFCALPHAASAEAVGALRERGVIVFDLSADFRFDDLATYEALYGKHPVAELLPAAQYGLVELHREALSTADLVAVPGCYPTAATLALAPLIDAGLVQTRGIVVDAKSGVSGAGRGLSGSTHFPEAAEGVRAYKAGVHRHGPEIEQELSRLVEGGIQLTFVPHLVPMTRGILATCYATAANVDATAERCTAAARALYEGSPSVHVLEPGEHPDTLWVRGSNRVHVAYARPAGSDTVIAMSAIDNLVKGAAGQAVQCLNVRFKLPEGAGLGSPAGWP